MGASEIIGGIALLLGIAGGVWGVIKGLLARDRKSVDDRAEAESKVNKEVQSAIWRRLDELRSEVNQVRIDQEVLKERIRSMPDHDALHAKLEAIEERLEKKLDVLVKQVQEAFAVATARFKCPHDPERGGA